ncbi:hypothetical protein NAT51_03630 [Flavobacterium amniphilum]|uniref:hypothetical protein n=1 Tax=Flavobacterium amniphilum TaxID=1834035 RepID=UPI002029E629|nr:hypothetical protein [Flavobacterium amniphilum]MCL9804597.1 hypothetical protein [Flavobacterium amniphilum]
MDYLKIYNTNYNKAYRIGESFMKHKLIQFNTEALSFGRASNLLHELFRGFREKLLINKTTELTELAYTYQKSLSNYSKNCIELVLKNEVRKGFSELNLTSTYNTYTFELFIKELAITNAMNELLRVFSNYSEMFKMMYDNDYFDSFEIQDYSPANHWDSKIYIDLETRFYPSRKSTETYSENFIETYLDNTIYDFESSIPLFNEKEKAYLLHSIYKIIEEAKGTAKLNNTEFYKVLSIVNLNDNSCLVSDNYKNSDYYRILSAGLEKISPDLKAQDNFIDILLSKTKELKLKNITKYLSEKSTFLKASIAKNKNKAK